MIHQLDTGNVQRRGKMLGQDKILGRRLRPIGRMVMRQDDIGGFFPDGLKEDLLLIDVYLADIAPGDEFG